MAAPSSWREKLDVPPYSEAPPAPEGRKTLRPGQLLLFPNGRDAETAIRRIPRGQTATVKELRDSLARRHGADMTCPVTAANCPLAVAEVAHEAHRAGAPIEDAAPVWRVLDARSPTLKRVSFDPAFILDQRAREGLDAGSRTGERNV